MVGENQNKTNIQFNEIVKTTRSIFVSKMIDYGATWRVFRPISIVDQLFIKAKRIRSIQNQGVQKIGDSIESEFIAIFNYSIMSLVQLKLNFTDEPDIEIDKASQYYDEAVHSVLKLMLDKNHDYGEAWRSMNLISIADIILVKLFRVKQIISNEGKTIVSEGIEGNIMDIANYAIFALILINEK